MPHAGAAKTSPPHDPGRRAVAGAAGSPTSPTSPGAGSWPATAARFWAIVVVLGVITGVGASALVGAAAARRAPRLRLPPRPVPGRRGSRRSAGGASLALVVAAVVVAVGTLRARAPAGVGRDRGLGGACGCAARRMAVVPSIARAVVSIVTVGLGVSLGREAAPQLAGAAAASWLSEWGELPTWQRRLLVASGAGAGFAAIYNVPLGGALFALEVLLGTVALPLVLPALATSVIATAVAWITLGHRADLPPARPTLLHPQQLAWAALAGPHHRRRGDRLGADRSQLGRRAAARRARAVRRAAGRVRASRAWSRSGTRSCWATARASSSSRRWASFSFGLLAVLLVLKPLATAGCLGAGSPGGLFTPTLTIGVLLAGVLGTVWSHIWPGRPGRAATRSSAAARSWRPRCRDRCPAWCWCSS